MSLFQSLNGIKIWMNASEFWMYIAGKMRLTNICRVIVQFRNSKDSYILFLLIIKDRDKIIYFRFDRSIDIDESLFIEILQQWTCLRQQPHRWKKSEKKWTYRKRTFCPKSKIGLYLLIQRAHNQYLLDWFCFLNRNNSYKIYFMLH